MNRRTGEVALIAIAIVLSLYGVLSGSWFGAGAPDEDASLRVGLREVTICIEARCQSRELTTISDDAAVTMGGSSSPGCSRSCSARSRAGCAWPRAQAYARAATGGVEVARPTIGASSSPRRSSRSR